MILEEMNVYLDTPQRYVGNVYDRLLYADQPLGWDILGTRETIEGATRETVHLVPRHLVPTGAHGRRHRRTDRRRPARAARGAPRRHRGAPDRRGRARRASARHARPCSSTRRRPSRRTSSSASAATRIGHPNRYALQLLAVVLGGGMSSRLFTEVRERRGLGYYVHAGSTAYTDAGTFYASAGVDVARVDEAITTILGELRKIAAEPVPADELEKARGVHEGPLRAPPREPAGDDPVRAPPRGARGRDRGPRRAAARSSTR